MTTYVPIVSTPFSYHTLFLALRSVKYAALLDLILLSE